MAIFLINSVLSELLIVRAVLGPPKHHTIRAAHNVIVIYLYLGCGSPPGDAHILCLSTKGTGKRSRERGEAGTLKLQYQTLEQLDDVLQKLMAPGDIG